MNKISPLVLAAITLVIMSSCSSGGSLSSSMPGMSAEEHAKMMKKSS